MTIGIEQTPEGTIEINAHEQTFTITQAEAWELLEWLWDRRSELFAASQHLDEEGRLHLLMQQGMQQRLQSLADHIVTGDTTIYRGGNDE